MKKQEMGNRPYEGNRIKRSTRITIICDAFLIVALAVGLVLYLYKNEQKIYNQNIAGISEIASGKSDLMLTALENSSDEVSNAFRYCNGKSITEVMDYLSLICNEGSEFQLLKYDEVMSDDAYYVYYGFSTKKTDSGYQEVRYKDTLLATSLYRHSSLEAGKVAYTQSFTNSTDAFRYFSVFCGIDIRKENGTERYWLVKPQEGSRILNQLKSYSQYKEMTTAICYADGGYLANDNSFRGVGFYDYLYRYNGLSIDEKNAIMTSVQNDSDGKGHIKYRDYKGRDCIFTYISCGEDKQWYLIFAVPESDFVSGEYISFLPLAIIVFLAIFLIFNISRLLVIVNQLRQSVERERIANSSKRSFLSRMSHEIRTPLNAVIGYNTIAKTTLSEANDEAQRKQAEMKVIDCLEKGGIASKHLLAIINDVLDMSAIESGKVKITHERFDFKGFISSLTAVFYSQASAKNVAFEVLFETRTEEWFVGDQMRINQILTNLLSNAIKFTPSGGTVKLKIRQPETDGNISCIHFEISDTGIGMSPEYLERIWMPFEQADSSISRRFGGSGLGLSITKNLIELMKGQIAVESTLGAGTTFKVDIDLERTEQPKMKVAYDFSRINALVVDDDESTGKYIRLLFNRFGAKCTPVSSGADAIKAVSDSIKSGNIYTLCLVDWRMPEMDGIETIRRIRALAEDKIPIIVLTAYDYTELADEAAKVDVTKFVSKPLFQSTLFDLLVNISGAHSIVTEKNDKERDFEGERILLAEDNAMNMEIAKNLLQSAGLTVDSAWNGKEAVDLFLSSETGTYLTVLMDIHMPEMDGYEATRTIRASSHPEAKTIPIIAMTADAFAENVAEARLAGMNEHIAKPIDFGTLFYTLKSYKKKRS